MAKGDVTASAGCIRYYGGWADKIVGQTIDIDPNSLTYTRHEPIGVCGQIIPWNFPLMMFAWKIGPALATGNTIVLKTAEQTPLSALYVAGLIKEAGFPPGVVNVLSGFGRVAGAAIAAHMDIDKVAFTGSTLVGRQIMQVAAKSNLKKVTLELGGKSPNIILPDANLEEAIGWVNNGIFFNHGQCCCAGSRILVHEDIYDKFIELFKKRAEQNKVGDPFKPDTFQGPQVSQLQYDRIMGYIEDGKNAGARIITGGDRHGSEGYYIQPTIFADVQEDMTIVKEEIFGPVCTVQKIRDEEEAIRVANSTNYGKLLAISIYCSDIFFNTRLYRLGCGCSYHKYQRGHPGVQRHQGRVSFFISMNILPAFTDTYPLELFGSTTTIHSTTKCRSEASKNRELVESWVLMPSRTIRRSRQFAYISQSPRSYVLRGSCEIFSLFLF